MCHQLDTQVEAVVLMEVYASAEEGTSSSLILKVWKEQQEKMPGQMESGAQKGYEGMKKSQS